MNSTSIKAIVGTSIAIVVAAAVATAGSQSSAYFSDWPLYALAVAFAFLIQWALFVPAYLKQTEHYFDLAGSLTFLSVSALAFTSGPGDLRAGLVALLVCVWAIRLGSFLFLRIRRDGFDRRFTHIKPNFFLFLMTWTLQGLWVSLSLAAGLVALTTDSPKPLGWVAAVGAAAWGLGFVIEVVADRQKRIFRSNPENKDRFITTGLWSISRHPNYLGEILLWCGIAIIAIPVLRGWQYVTLVSPLFVTLLLTKISGVRMLEASAKRRWADDADYQKYLASTPVLLPGFRKKASS